jgi:hypothetical protein
MQAAAATEREWSYKRMKTIGKAEAFKGAIKHAPASCLTFLTTPA